MINQNLLLTGDDAYNLTKSLRFRSSASAYLNRTQTAGNRQTWTWSGWVKRGKLGAKQNIFGFIYYSPPNNNQQYFSFDSDDTINIEYYTGSSYVANLKTTQVFRDSSAWYHIVLTWDTTNATSSDRVRLYVNGARVTAFSTASYPSQNNDGFINQTGNDVGIGRVMPYATSEYLDGYISELNFIDGQALTPSSFGETDVLTGVWKPKKYAGTYGTNGFYLPFTDVATTSGSNAGLGKDFSGNGNYWTTNNISVTAGTTYDSMNDVPTLTSADTANYCTLNPLDHDQAGLSVTLSNGNLTASGSSYGVSVYRCTFQVPQSGKWYWESVYTAITSTVIVGIRSYSTGSTDVQYRSDGQKVVGGTTSAYGASWTTNDVIGIAVDRDAGTVTFYKNNSSQGVINIPTNSAAFDIAFNTASPYGSTTANINFGQQPFSYTPPTGFVALNTFNLPEPSIKQGNKHFDATVYTGNDTTNAIVNSGGFQPDMIWLKNRATGGYDHEVYDSIRGTGDKALVTNGTYAEAVDTGYINLVSFNSNGFTLGSTTFTNVINKSGQSHVGWQWKANGTGSSNTAGSITSTVSVNATAGFSVVTYTGNGTSGATIGHGLGVAPSMVIVKSRTTAYDWFVYHKSLGATKVIYLDLTDAAGTNSSYWNNTEPSSSVFTVGVNNGVNQSSQNFVAYCWSEIAGYSKALSWTGNGSTDGVFVNCGFSPAFIIMKRTDSTSDWVIIDNKRLGYNVTDVALNPNASYAENSGYATDFLSNGFKLRTTTGYMNASGGTYIGFAFAQNPFKNSLAR